MTYSEKLDVERKERHWGKAMKEDLDERLEHVRGFDRYYAEEEG